VENLKYKPIDLHIKQPLKNVMTTQTTPRRPHDAAVGMTPRNLAKEVMIQSAPPISEFGVGTTPRQRAQDITTQYTPRVIEHKAAEIQTTPIEEEPRKIPVFLRKSINKDTPSNENVEVTRASVDQSQERRRVPVLIRKSVSMDIPTVTHTVSVAPLVREEVTVAPEPFKERVIDLSSLQRYEPPEPVVETHQATLDTRSSEEIRQERIKQLAEELHEIEKGAREEQTTSVQEESTPKQETPRDPIHDQKLQDDYVAYLKNLGIYTDIMPATSNIIANDRMDKSLNSVYSLGSYSEAPSVSSSLMSLTSHIPPETYLNRSLTEGIIELEKKEALRDKLQAFMKQRAPEIVRESLADDLSEASNTSRFRESSDNHARESLSESLGSMRHSAVQHYIDDADGMLAEIISMEKEIEAATKTVVRIRDYKQI
jgi:hypothetical protein